MNAAPIRVMLSAAGQFALANCSAKSKHPYSPHDLVREGGLPELRKGSTP